MTVTHPSITRYFMSLSEATQLLLQAGLMGKGGEVLLLDMGEPVRIVDLARDMIRLSGADPDRIRIAFTGLAARRKTVRGAACHGRGDAADAASQAAHRAGTPGKPRCGRSNGRVAGARPRRRRRRGSRLAQELDSRVRPAGQPIGSHRAACCATTATVAPAALAPAVSLLARRRR